MCSLCTECLRMCSLHMYTSTYSAGAPTVTNEKNFLPPCHLPFCHIQAWNQPWFFFFNSETFWYFPLPAAVSRWKKTRAYRRVIHRVILVEPMVPPADPIWNIWHRKGSHSSAAKTRWGQEVKWKPKLSSVEEKTGQIRTFTLAEGIIWCCLSTTGMWNNQPQQNSCLVTVKKTNVSSQVIALCLQHRENQIKSLQSSVICTTASCLHI